MSEVSNVGHGTAAEIRQAYSLDNRRTTSSRMTPTRSRTFGHFEWVPVAKAIPAMEA
jgi:hypothetical protein